MSTGLRLSFCPKWKVLEEASAFGCVVASTETSVANHLRAARCRPSAHFSKDILPFFFFSSSTILVYFQWTFWTILEPSMCRLVQSDVALPSHTEEAIQPDSLVLQRLAFLGSRFFLLCFSQNLHNRTKKRFEGWPISGRGR